MKRVRYHNKKKRTGSKFRQGFYKPQNPEKFRSSNNMMNKGEYPFYRSSWELLLYKYFDCSDEVEYWGTESIFVEYQSPKDNQIHRYFPDILVKNKNGSKIIIEVKPQAQTTYPINEAKFKAAEQYAKEIGAKFVVVTEVHLKKWGLLK